MMKASVRSIAWHLPTGELTNGQLADEFKDWDAEKIRDKTGILCRRVAARDECASDLGVAAAKALFAQDAIAPEQIDFLIFCTQSPDYLLPTTACLVQERLGLRTTCGAVDINQGCSGFVYGLALAKGLVETGAASNVLLITAETYSKFINPRDRSVRTLFGDAAAATLVSGVETDRDLIGPFVFGTDGRGAPQLIVPTGGMRQPRTSDSAVEQDDGTGNWRSQDNLYMNGPEIFNFTLKTVPAAMAQLLEKSGRTLDQIDHFVFHQANQFMLERLRSKARIPTEKFVLDMEDCGNTVSSTIPIALARSLAKGRIGAGDTVALVGFGVGFSWAATLMEVV